MADKESTSVNTNNTDAEMVIYRNILGQVVVTISMHDRDWLKLEKSEAWKEVCHLLEASQTVDNHLILIDQKGLSETEYCKNPLRKFLFHVCARRRKRV